MKAFVESLGRKTRQFFFDMLYSVGFFVEVLRDIPGYFAMGRRRSGGGVLIMQILFTGVGALSIIAVIAAGIGAIIIVQGLSLLPQFGQGQMIYVILVTVITRELGPILTATIVAARSGTAITTELGTMVVNREIEAYLATGINPITYLAVPRLLAMVIAMVLLNIYFNLFGWIGSFFVTQIIRPFSIQEYAVGIYGAVTLFDITMSFIKSAVFGIIVGTVATHQGFRVERAGTEVPVRAIRSVSLSIALIVVANALITLLSYL